MGCVGATLYRGNHSSCQSAVSKYSSMICFRRRLGQRGAKLATAASLPAHGLPTLPNNERQNG
jgi:hypothetical protein